jgi:predicted  nucleic acid-binding Zn-ribbon protein
MISPCRKCGATKTEPVRHGIIYKVARASGYRLCQCSRCRKLRLIRRHDDVLSTSLKSGKEAATVACVAEEGQAPKPAQKDLEPKINQPLAAADSSHRGSHRCPDCGSTKYHRTKRTALEHLLLRPPMARCELCRSRFPYPKHRHGSSSSAKLREAAATTTAPHPAEEKRAARMAEQNTQPQVSKLVDSADSSRRGAPCCPTCASTKYHRTKRTSLEHFLLRPRMARCENCGARFPYPRHHHRSSSSAESGQAATVPRLPEEKMAPKTGEEKTRPELTKPGASADSSSRGLGGCPACGSSKYHRTKRTTLEHLLLRPRMAHCEKCGARFPYPGHHGKSPEPVKSGEVATTVSRVGQEERDSTTAEESFQPKVAKQEAAPDSSNGGVRGCPACGSTSYRRTARTTLERILLRPKMARCRKCRQRFPLPER